MAKEEKNNAGKLKPVLNDRQTNDAISQMIARHVVQLSEHVSSIQVVGTKLELDGTTTRFAYGSGDMYARAKAMEAFLEQVEETL